MYLIGSLTARNDSRRALRTQDPTRWRRFIKSRSRWITPAASRPSPEGSGGYASDLSVSLALPSDFFTEKPRPRMISATYGGTISSGRTSNESRKRVTKSEVISAGLHGSDYPPVAFFGCDSARDRSTGRVRPGPGNGTHPLLAGSGNRADCARCRRLDSGCALDVRALAA